MKQIAETTIIRLGRIEDLPKLTEIYNYYIIHTAITFDIEPYTLEERKERWFDKFRDSEIYRLFVAECDGIVVGYATSGQFRDKAAYASSVETSIYLDSNFNGRGLGTLLYQKLFEELEKTSVHRAYGGITLPNCASIALHKKFGFNEIGTYNEVGNKFGKYHDVKWFERKMNAHQ